MTVYNQQEWLCLFFISSKGTKIYGGFWRDRSEWYMEFHYQTAGKCEYFKEVVNRHSKKACFNFDTAERNVRHLACCLPIIHSSVIVPVAGSPVKALEAFKELPINLRLLKDPILN